MKTTGFFSLMFLIISMFLCLPHTFAQEPTVLEHGGAVSSVAFSPVNPALLASAGGHNTVKVWNLRDNTVKILKGHTEAVNSVTFSPDGKWLVSGSGDATIKMWDISRWQNIETREPITFRMPSSVPQVAFHPNGQLLATSGRHVQLLDIINQTEIATLPHDEWAWLVAFSDDGRYLATDEHIETTVKIWDVEKRHITATLNGHAGDVNFVKFSPDTRTLATTSWGGDIKLWGVSNWELLGTLQIKRKFKDSYYDVEAGRVWEEIYEQFDTFSNVYLTALDIKSEVFKDGQACGLGGYTSNHSGTALVPASGDCFNVDVIAHELGHAFGLPHDYRTNPKLILSAHTADRMIRSFCAAEWLDAHRYFNTHKTGFNELTTIEMHPPQAVPPDAIRLRFEVSDPEGLHQALLLTPEFEQTGGLIACQRLNGTSSTAEFVVPKTIFRHRSTVTLRVIDRHGNFAVEDFYSDPQAGPKIEGPWVWMIVPTGVDGSAAATSGIDYLAEASGGAVTEQQVATNRAKVDGTIGDKVWTPGNIAPTGADNITELVNAIGLGEGYIDNHVAYGSIVLDSPRIQETRMHVGSDDAVKVWLNGVLVHDNPVDRGAKDYQENFPVTLKQGTNILLVAVYEGAVYWSGFFGFDADAEYTVLIPDALDLPTQIAEDVNSDGVVNIQDLVLVAASLGQAGENVADVNGDGMVNIQDLVLVAGALGNAAAAPSFHPQVLSTLTAADIQKWLTQAQHLDRADTRVQSGIRFLEQLLAALIRKETTLLANYPNPFNPETWIPYQLAKPADVTLRIYSVNGSLVQTLALGHQPAGIYQSRARAAFWNGRNALGEPVASGVYFYTLTAGEFTATRKMLIRK